MTIDCLQITWGPNSSLLRFILLVPLSCLHAWHFSFPLHSPPFLILNLPFPSFLFVLFPLLWEGVDSWGSHWSLNFLNGWPMTLVYTRLTVYLQVWINFGIEDSLKLAHRGRIFENGRFFCFFVFFDVFLYTTVTLFLMWALVISSKETEMHLTKQKNYLEIIMIILRLWDFRVPLLESIWWVGGSYY